MTSAATSRTRPTANVNAVTADSGCFLPEDDWPPKCGEESCGPITPTGSIEMSDTVMSTPSRTSLSPLETLDMPSTPPSKAMTKEATMSRTPATTLEASTSSMDSNREEILQKRIQIWNQAWNYTERVFSQSRFGQDVDQIPMLSRSDLVLGSLLGQGTFSNVYEIENDICLQKYDDAMSASIADDETSPNSSRFVVKQLRKDVLRDGKRLMNGCLDLAMEIRFISSLRHPHIQSLRGMVPVSGMHLLIVDRLQETLKQRIRTWKLRQRKSHPLLGGVWCRLVQRKWGLGNHALLDEALCMALDLTQALAYMHDLRIIHRDVRPEHIGFTQAGTLRLFDFGKARELPMRNYDRSADGEYHLSIMAGSIPYMAPEVANGKPYNAKCDVYSFALVLWEMLALQQPFRALLKNKSSNKTFEATFAEKVFMHGLRPPISALCWPSSIQSLLESAWQTESAQRPSMPEIQSQLRKTLVQLHQLDSAVSADISTVTSLSRPRLNNNNKDCSRRKNRSKSSGTSSSGSPPLGDEEPWEQLDVDPMVAKVMHEERRPSFFDQTDMPDEMGSIGSMESIGMDDNSWKKGGRRGSRGGSAKSSGASIPKRVKVRRRRAKPVALKNTAEPSPSSSWRVRQNDAVQLPLDDSEERRLNFISI